MDCSLYLGPGWTPLADSQQGSHSAMWPHITAGGPTLPGTLSQSLVSVTLGSTQSTAHKGSLSQVFLQPIPAIPVWSTHS